MRMPWGPVALIAVAAGVGCGSPLGPAPLGGEWGGDHATLVVTAVGATAEFDCAYGTLAERPLLDADGTFDVPGRYTPTVGPLPENPPGLPAHYRGAVRLNVMTLTVTLDEQNQTLGPFTLLRDAPSTIVQCRAV